MKTVLLLLIGMIAVLSSATAQEPKVRASLATKDDVWVGQRITLVVELLAPGYFASAASFQLPDSAGMMLMPPSGSPVVGSETIDGVSYTVQRHELSVFARRSGPQTIPPLTASFRFKRQPLAKDTVAATVKTEPLSFTTKVPPGAEKLGSVISARDLKVVETWQPEPGNAKAGDAFTRTITFSAPEVPAMAFPPFPATRIDGLGIYPKAPEVLDHSERGALSGQRRDAITYICQRSGQFTIPATRLTWFDLDAQKLQVIEFPAQIFTVAPNPAFAGDTTQESPTHRHPSATIARILFALLGIGLTAGLLWWTRPFWLSAGRVFLPAHLAPLNPLPAPPAERRLEGEPVIRPSSTQP